VDIPHAIAESHNLPSLPTPLSAEINQGLLPAETLRPDFFSTELFFGRGGEFNFESKGFKEEPRLARKKKYSSIHRNKKKRLSQRGKMKLDKNYFKDILSDIEYALPSPWRWNSSDWATASIVAGTTGILYVLDDEINDDFKDNRSSTTDDLSDVFEPFGNSAIVFPTLVGFYLYGQFGENEKIERTALLAAESFLVSSLFNSVLKVVMRRTRPFDGVSAGTFDSSFTGNNSFPSGHTTTAFAIATVVANEYEKVPFIAPISYGIATLMGLSRLNDQKHWASDVFFGAALGYFTSKTILRLHSNKKGRHFTIYPRAGYRSGGLVLSSRF
jgi:membrane-associated phospholipid phosphatase